LAKEEKNFLFLQIFSREKKGRCTLGSDLKNFLYSLAKQIGYLNSYRKNTQFQKNNWPKWSLGSEVMNILNPVISRVFPEKAAIFCSKLFLILVFFQDLSPERCFSLEKMMALILNNS
jgi:hypothetical protein